jgi:hypothetical protein
LPCQYSQPSLLDEARKLAESEGVALNQLINVALADKISALRTEEYFAERAQRANPEKIALILERIGKGRPPREGDELPAAFKSNRTRKLKWIEQTNNPGLVFLHY